MQRVADTPNPQEMAAIGMPEDALDGKLLIGGDRDLDGDAIDLAFPAGPGRAGPAEPAD